MVRRASFGDRRHLQDLCGELPWRGSSGTHRGGGAGDGRRCSWDEAQRGNPVIQCEHRQTHGRCRAGIASARNLQLLSARDQSAKWTGARQDRARLARQHCRHRARLGGVSGRGRARLHHARGGDRDESSPHCDFSGTARKAPSRTLPATTAFIIIFSTCRPAGAPGNANCRRWTAPFCSPVR